MLKCHLVLLIHAHQPVGNFDHVLERTYRRAYLPFVECLREHPSVRLGLHYSGPLLEWLEKGHPEFFDLLRELLARGQVELVGGGFYEPILIAIPPEDQQEQLRRLADYLGSKFGKRPAGAWLAERVWEPQLPAVLAQAQVSYTLVDDVHFLASGFEPHQLHGYYIAEEQGQTVKVIPGLKALRYLLPFRSVGETLDFLRCVARDHPGGMAAMGDDCEKFGAWPGTHEHCYTHGWLDSFFRALEENSTWLATTLPGDYLTHNPPLGRADLPTASYPEMMEWVLPTAVQRRFQALQQEFASRPDAHAFVRIGVWRGFFSKYSEANLLHKKMLYVSRKIRGLRAGRRRGPVQRRKLDQAIRHLLRGQCNDAYWHGIFGGLYAPHLRTALWQELLRAEKLADRVEHGRSRRSTATRLDFDADGHEEIYLTSPLFSALVNPTEGGTLMSLDFRSKDVALINSLARRPEAYHAQLHAGAAGAEPGVTSIHEQVRFKEQGLERRLRYDRWPRHAFRLLLFAPGKSHGDYEAVRLEESAAFAGGPYDVLSASPEEVQLACQRRLAPSDAILRAVKTFAFAQAKRGFRVNCEVALASQDTQPRKLQVGLEMIVNFLAADEPDRYFEFAGNRHPLNWSAAVPASQLRVVDHWQGVAVALEAEGASQFWVVPIETISQSEAGFERVYQGSQILAVWPAELSPGTPWVARLVLHVGPAR